MTLNERFSEFLSRDISKHTRNKYYYRLRPFLAHHGEKEPEEVTTEMIAAHINQEHLSEASKAILRSCFHAFFGYMGLDENPVKPLPHWRDTPPRVTVPNEVDVRRVMNEAVTMSLSGSPRAKRDSLILTFSVMSGNRRGELRALKIGDVLDALKHPENGLYRAESIGKTGLATVRFSGFHVPLIERYNAVRPPCACHYYFVNLNPHHSLYGQQLSLVGLDRARVHVCSRAGVRVTFQELRRRLATIIARKHGVDIAAHALGHSPHSGDRVIRAFYYDPDIAAVDAACLGAFPGN